MNAFQEKLMYELNNDEFNKVMPLLKNGFNHPEILSIIQRNNPGWIFVDNKYECKTALVWNQGMQGFYLIGDKENEDCLQQLDSYITEFIAPRMKSVGLNYFEISASSDDWILRDLFPQRELSHWVQYVYKYFRKEKISVLDIEGYNIRPIVIEDVLRGELLNKEFVLDALELFWGDVEYFRTKGIGYMALHGSEIISVCYTSFTTNDTQAIGIETTPEHRKKGIGLQLAARVVNDVIDKGYLPYWDCTSDNEGSKKIAEKLGFIKNHQYSCVGFPI